MTKKIAIMARERQSEALRMAVGAILLDDDIHVYVLDHGLDKTEETVLYMETLNDLDIPVFTNCAENPDLQLLSDKEIARRLSGYDHVIAY